MQDFLSLVTLFLASANAVGAHVPVLNNVYQGQTVFEHKHQRNFVAPSGSSVVKQVIASVTSGKPAYSTSVGAATTSVAKRSEPTELPVQRRDDVRPARKMERRQTSGVMQNIVYATTLSTPNATSTAYAGAASQSPVLQYLPHQDAELEYFNPSGFNNAINSTLSTAYPVYNGTQTLMIDSDDTMMPIDILPWFGRDNGKGGHLNGQQIFMFADTGTHPVNSTDHDEVDFFASSVAIDQGRLAAPGVPPVMVDHPGEYDDATPVQRGFVGYTEGEYAFTVDQEQYGNRYALWPESGITYLDSTRAVHWAAIVYVCAPCQNVFSTAGNTLLEITVDPIGGPHAERVVTELFGQNETQYGTVAGVRSWGSEGPGGMDGYVYAIATVSEGFSGGLLLSRVTPENVADKSSYEYYLNSTRSWSSTPPNATDPSADFFLAGAYANLDLLYSPRHLSWVLVYETPYADNRFYYQVLKATEPILPSYAGGNYDDIVTAVYEFPWSDPILLFQAPTPANGHYVYGGGVNPGYFDDDDFVNGGTKMLVHWSEPLAYGDWHEYYTDSMIVYWD